MADAALITVRTQVVLDTLVGSIAEAVAARVDKPLEAPVEGALAALGGEQRLARMGYLARAVEVARFERAREPMPRLARDLAGDRPWSEAAADLASRLAAAEPPERPDPADERAVSWKVPGPGGHVRHYLSIRAGVDESRPGGVDAKRSWLAGFLVHCICEAAPP